MKENKEIRLQKIISEAGLASRRQAEQLIEEGRVEINGNIASLGDKADPTKDAITIDGRKLKPKTSTTTIVLAMNKPKGYICSHGDPYHSKTIYDLLPKKYLKQKLHCAGRLDKDSEGLVILTSDGELANRIMHPSFDIVKKYHVTLSKGLEPKLIPVILKGVKSEGETLFAQKVVPLNGIGGTEVEVHLTQGRKREIRRIFEYFKIFVNKLKRIQIGGYTLKTIPRGRVKELTEKEIDLIFKK